VYAEIFPKVVGPCFQGGVRQFGNFISKVRYIEMKGISKILFSVNAG